MVDVLVLVYIVLFLYLKLWMLFNVCYYCDLVGVFNVGLGCSLVLLGALACCFGDFDYLLIWIDLWVYGVWSDTTFVVS